MATLDVLTLEEAKNAVNLSQSRVGNDEDVLEVAVTAVSLLLDDLCGPVVVRTITDELVDAPLGDLYTIKSPLYSVTSLKEYVNGTATTLTAETHLAAGTYRIVGQVGDHDRHIERRSSWALTPWSYGQVLITYVAGRFTSTETVDARFKKAAAEILSGNWTKYAAAWARGGDPLADPLFFDEVSNTVNRWLAHERFYVSPR